MFRFVHIGFAFPGALKMRDLEPAFNALGGDWIRYSATNWIIWTDKPSNQIFYMIRAFLDNDDQVLIAPINVHELFGSLQPWIWNWMNSKLSSPAINTNPANALALASALRQSKP